MVGVLVLQFQEETVSERSVEQYVDVRLPFLQRQAEAILKAVQFSPQEPVQTLHREADRGRALPPASRENG